MRRTDSAAGNAYVDKITETLDRLNSPERGRDKLEQFRTMETRRLEGRCQAGNGMSAGTGDLGAAKLLYKPQDPPSNQIDATNP